MRKAFIVTALLMAAMWLTAQTGPQHPSPVDGAGITMPSGVAYWDLKMGTGAVAAKGSKVKVNYTAGCWKKARSSTAHTTMGLHLSLRLAREMWLKDGIWA